MSYKYRRQSIYLQRKSLSRGTSTADPYDDWIDGNSTATAIAAAAAANAQITPPNVETMKVIKGFEFVTFTPVEIEPPSGDCDTWSFANTTDIDQTPATKTRCNSRSMSISSSYSPTESRVKSFNLDRMPESIEINEISESDARNSLCGYVGNKFCYGTKAAIQMNIRDIIHSYIFQYTLESFCEKRELCWTFEPYTGGCLYLDSPISNNASCNHSTPPDNAWNIEVDEVKMLEKYAASEKNSAETNTDDESLDNEEPKNESNLFQNKVINLTVPGTVSVHSCHNCGGIGRKRCITCIGSGSKTCQTCHGNGYYGYYHKSALTKTFESSDYCWRCHGRGRLRCYGCNGDGMTACAACLGSGQIKCYIKLIVTLNNHANSVLIRDHNSADVPLDMLNTAEGDVIFEERGHNLCHISNFIDDSITKESQRLIEMHSQNFLNNSKLILQRHRIKVIPVAKVISVWQRKQFHFYVFGTQHRCYTTNYPQRFSCSCCCIL